MKIAVLLLSGGHVNRGAETGTFELISLWSKSHQVTLFQSGTCPKKHKYSCRQISVPLVAGTAHPHNIITKFLNRLYFTKRGFVTLIFALKCFPSLIKEKYDIIHPVDGFFEIMIAKVVRLIKGSKIIIVAQAGGWTDDDNLKLNPDLFVAMTPSSLERAKSLRPQVKSVLIPGAIGPFPETSPRNLNLKKPVIITVAAFNRYKRHDLTIKAVDQLKDVSLLLVGSGEEEQAIRRYCEKLLSGRFQILTARPEELPALYAAADVFTLVSEPQEAFGRVFLEAMNANLPIVARDDPSRRWLIGKEGYFVDPNDVSAYAKALHNALIAKDVTYPHLDSFRPGHLIIEWQKAFNELAA